MRALEPADRDGALGKVEIIPAQVTGFAHPQAVAIDQQTNQPITMAVAVGLQRRQQLGHLGFGQMLADAVGSFGLASNWSHISAFDQLEVARFHWSYPCVRVLNCSHNRTECDHSPSPIRARMNRFSDCF